MVSWPFRQMYRRGIHLGVLLFFLLLGMGTTDLRTAYAVTYELTSDGLGLSAGNYGTSLTVSPNLTLSALTKGSASGYPNGVPGTIYVHPTDGTGVQNEVAQGSKGVDGTGKDAHESLVFDFSVAVDVQSITIWINKFDQPSVDLWVKPTSGSAIQANSVLTYFHFISNDAGYVNFSEIPEFTGIGSIVRIIVKATGNSHFYINRIDCVVFTDADGDGYPADNDCNDSDPTINPGATEVCNGVDDNCDGDIDEGCILYYRDADGDGYGDPGDTTTIPQSGYVPNGSDCDDTDASIHPGATEVCNGADDDCDGSTDEGCTLYYLDADGDGYGDPDNSITNTSPPPGYVANGGDCNDSDATINPGAIEVCNGADDNCDGNTDEGCTLYYLDSDGDGYGDPGNSVTNTSPPPGYVANGGDCNDSDATINPGAIEACNGFDDNCDGNTDEGCATYYRDADTDGYGNAADSVVATSPPSGYVANADDCNDNDATIYPGATEACDGADNDCDGNTDEGCGLYYRDADSDGYGDPSLSTTTPQPGYVPNGSDCNDGDPNINPGATEVCNGVDDNCDGNTDEGCATYYRDADADGYGDPSQSITATSQPPGYVANGSDCNDADMEIYPGSTERCNGVDDDCDGNVDEGCVTYYEDADGDGYGNPDVTKSVASPAPPPGYVANAGDCNDNKGQIHPGATERCNNSTDDDCDGHINEGCISGAGSGGVGGVAWPVDAVALLAPWIAAMVFLAALAVSAIIWVKRRHV